MKERTVHRDMFDMITDQKNIRILDLDVNVLNVLILMQILYGLLLFLPVYYCT